MISDFQSGCFSGSQPVMSDAFGDSLDEGFVIGLGAVASPDRPAFPEQQQEPGKQQPEVPQVDPAMDFEEGGTGPAPTPAGGFSVPAAVVTTGVVVTDAAHMHRIRILEDLILDSPSPLGLLDPPKA
jgi:hypothetical protein